MFENGTKWVYLDFLNNIFGSSYYYIEEKSKQQ